MQLPNSKKLEINRLASVFDRKTATYKFYWFLSILDILVESNKTKMSFGEIVATMMSHAWYPSLYFKVSFGRWDSFDKYLSAVQDYYGIPTDEKTDKIRKKLLSNVSDKLFIGFINELTDDVPYRFLTPWIKFESNAITVKKSQEYYNDCLFKIEDVDGFKTITINPNWKDYLIENYNVLKDFIYWNLLEFLQKRNPNVPNLSAKLIRDVKRESLTSQRDYWNEYIESVGSINCIYTNKVIYPKQYDLDHFIPWAFVADNMFWNLIPADSSINSSKSDNLPDLDRYLPSFAKIHHKALPFFFKQHEDSQMIEDYLTIYESIPELINLSDDKFYEVFKRQFSPMVQIAENKGFKSMWKI